VDVAGLLEKSIRVHSHRAITDEMGQITFFSQQGAPRLFCVLLVTNAPEETLRELALPAQRVGQRATREHIVSDLRGRHRGLRDI
jgi:hypothetical protein